MGWKVILSQAGWGCSNTFPVSFQVGQSFPDVQQCFSFAFQVCVDLGTSSYLAAINLFFQLKHLVKYFFLKRHGNRGDRKKKRGTNKEKGQKRQSVCFGVDSFKIKEKKSHAQLICRLVCEMQSTTQPTRLESLL